MEPWQSPSLPATPPGATGDFGKERSAGADVLSDMLYIDILVSIKI